MTMQKIERIKHRSRRKRWERTAVKEEKKQKNRHPSLSPRLRDCHSVEPLTVTALIRVRGTEVERAKKR